MDLRTEASKLSSNPHRWVARTALAIAVAAFLLRAAFILVVPARPFQGDMITYDGIARNIVQGRWHFGWGEEPSAHREPLYPLFVAAIYKLSGGSRFAVHWAQAAVDSVTCALVVLLALRLLTAGALAGCARESAGRTARLVAVTAGAMAAIYPPSLEQIQTTLSEPLATLILAAAMYYVVSAFGAGNGGRLVVGGVLLGLATLTRSASLMYPLVLGVGILALRRGRELMGARAAIGFVAVFLAVLSPWTVRNYLVFHRFIPVGVNAGIVLFYGNYDGPKPDPEIEAMTEGMDEVGRDRFLMKLGIQRIKEDPLGFVLRSFRKLPRFWLNVGFDEPPSRASVAFAVGNSVILALALWGILGTGLVNHRAALPAYVLILYFTALHAMLVARGRYSLPIMPYVLSFAAVGLVDIARRVGIGPSNERPAVPGQ